MTFLCLFLVTFLMGILAGIHLSAQFHDAKIADLSGPAYTAMHQMRDKTFRVVMPPLRLFALAILVLPLFGPVPWLGKIFLILAIGFHVTGIVLTVRKQVPLNKYVMTWNIENPPADWQDTRDQWAKGNLLRVGVTIVAFLLTLIAFGIAA